MFKETKKIIQFVMLLLPALLPLTGAHAATLGLPCGGDESAYVEEFMQSPDPNLTEEQRNAELERRRQIVQDNFCQLKDIFTGFAQVINFLIGAIGIFVVFRLVVAGFQMASSMGNEGQTKAAKEALSNAIKGLLLVLLAYLIVNTIFEVFEVRIGFDAGFNFPFDPRD